jgi:phospholipid-binding lipoprotein MlaA
MRGERTARIACALVALAACACRTPPPPQPQPPHATTPLAAALPDVAAEPDDDWLFEDQEGDPAERDDAEGLNRRVFWVNEHFYDYVADPIAAAYETVVPEAGRRAVDRFFDNLDLPAIFVNDVLQLAPRDAGETFLRFLVNSTVGAAGFFDPAGDAGLEGHTTDFGETLGVYGVPAGSYLVIPLLGPATVRDALGEAVDAFLRVDIWVLGGSEVLLATTGSGLATYSIERERLDALRSTSIDFYASLRSAYLMDRDAALEDRIERLGRDPEKPDVASGPAPACNGC